MMPNPNSFCRQSPRLSINVAHGTCHPVVQRSFRQTEIRPKPIKLPHKRSETNKQPNEPKKSQRGHTCSWYWQAAFGDWCVGLQSPPPSQEEEEEKTGGSAIIAGVV